MLIVRDSGVVIAMIYVNRTTTVVIQVKYLFVTMVFPPHTQLAIPRTGQDIKLAKNWVTVRRGLSNVCPRMVPTICPGDMFVDRLLFMSYSDYVCGRKLFKFRKELVNVCSEFQVCVQHDKFGDVGK